MRFLFGFLAVVPVLAAASFETVFIADNGDANNPGRIHRYDPVTGAHLGAIGVGDSNSWKALAINPAAGELYTSYNLTGGTVAYDYDTGYQKRAVAPQSATVSQFFDPTSNRIGVAADTVIRSFNVVTGDSKIFLTPGGTSFRWGVSASDGTVYWGESSGDRIYRGADSTAVPTLVGSIGANRIGPFFVSATSFIRSNGQTSFAWPDSDENNSFSFVSLSTATSLGTNGTVAVPAFSVIRGIAPAHSGFYLVGRTPAVTWGLQHVRPDLTLGRFITLPEVKGEVFDMAGVVAPEPGTMLALGAGLCAMLRRRHR